MEGAGKAVRSSVDEANIDVHSEVSIFFRIDGVACSKISMFALFDTGSPASFVRASMVPQLLPDISRNRPTVKTKFSGINQTPIYAYGKANCELNFNNVTKFVDLHIVPDNTISVSCLLGRNFFDTFNISLSMNINKNRANIETKKIEIHVNSVLLFEDNSENSSRITSNNKLDSVIIHNSVIQSTTNCVAYMQALSLNPHNCDWLESISPLVLCDKYFCSTYRSNNYEQVCSIDENKSEFLIGIEETNDVVRSIIEHDYINKPADSNREIKFDLKIKLSSETPFHYAPRRLSYAEKDSVRAIVDDLLKDNIVRPSESPYASQIVLVKRKNGQYRMCVDYRSLNKLTVRDNYPLPLIDDCLDHLADKKYFSLIDLKNGFHQVNVDPESV